MWYYKTGTIFRSYNWILEFIAHVEMKVTFKIIDTDFCDIVQVSPSEKKLPTCGCEILQFTSKALSVCLEILKRKNICYTNMLQIYPPICIVIYCTGQ